MGDWRIESGEAIIEYDWYGGTDYTGGLRGTKL